jgi:ribosomal protein RSM22 (predicted rRNA methylase)
MMAVDLPRELREGIDRALRDSTPADLARATARLSACYRAPAARGTAVVRSPAHALGYAAVRLPATFAAVTAALVQVRRLCPDWRPRTLLDLGAGPGTGLWAAAGVWLSLDRAVAVEADPHMIALGRRLARSAVDGAVAARAYAAVHDAVWIAADLTGSWPRAEADLVLIAYVLGEVPPAVVGAVVERAWAATTGTLVVVEPGTSAGYRRMLDARGLLLARGGFVTAPCPHDAPCPMAGGDWCHFAVRLPRSRVHRVLKHGALGYEDEKFSYVAVSRAPTRRTAARVLRHPTVGPGRVSLELCTPAGITTTRVTKGAREAFRQARKVAWGEGLEAEEVSPEADAHGRPTMDLPASPAL